MPDNPLLEAFRGARAAFDRLAALEERGGLHFPVATLPARGKPAVTQEALDEALQEYMDAHAEFVRLFREKYPQVGAGNVQAPRPGGAGDSEESGLGS
jgi:hypothetical protein